MENGSLIHTLEGHSDWVRDVALSADGRRAVSASDYNTLKVWDVENGSLIHTLEGHSDWVYGVALSADGRRAVSASDDNTLKVWDVTTGKVIATFTSDSQTLCCAMIADRIVAGDAIGRVHFLRLEEPKPRK